MTLETHNPNGSSSSTTDVLPQENHADSLTHYTSHCGTVIPNRIFVGGFDREVNERELQHLFSQHGAVKKVNIVTNLLGISKGYGFVTFETQEEVLKILHDANGICFKDRKLNIGQAIRKRHASPQFQSFPVAYPKRCMPPPISCGTLFHSTSSGCPYTYHNGMAYFYSPNMNPTAHHWPPAPPAMLPQSHQPVYQQPACHRYQCQLNFIQPLVLSSPVVNSQETEYPYQPADGGSVHHQCQSWTPMTSIQEALVQQVYAEYPQMTDGMTAIVLQHEPGKNWMFPHSWDHLKPKYHQYIHHKNHHYLLEATEPLATSMHHTSQPLM